MNRSISASLCRRTMALGLAGAALLAATPEARADDHLHDGFYMQVGAGLGYYNVSAEAGGMEASYSGVTVPLSLMLGGSPIEGLAVGGGLMIDYAPSPSYEMNGQDFGANVDFSQYVIGIGPFADYYLDPKGGLHFQGFVGWGGLETSTEGNAGGSDPTGLIMAVGAGYDFFIGRQWSFGGVGRLTVAPFSMNDVGFTTIEPALLATLTYH